MDQSLNSVSDFLSWSQHSFDATKIIFFSSVFGLFGGLVGHLAYNERETDPAKHFPSKLSSCLIGAAGSIGFLFFIFAVGGVTKFFDIPEKIRLLSLSTIAGFGARKLLPAMLSKVEDQIADIKHRVDETATVTTGLKETQAKLDSEQKRLKVEQELRRDKETELSIYALNSKLIDATRPEVSSARKIEIINEAENWIQTGTSPSKIYVNLARVYRWSDRIDDAINLLTTLEKIFDQGQREKDKYYTDLMYNKSLYLFLRSKIMPHTRHVDETTSGKCLSVFFESTKDLIGEITFFKNDPDFVGYENCEPINQAYESAKQKGLV